MASLARVEQRLLGKKLLEAEIDNLMDEVEGSEMQLSMYVLAARNLQVSIQSKVHRQVKFMVDGQIFESRSVVCEGIVAGACWNEGHLVPVRNLESCLKIVYFEYETASKPLGGVVIKLVGLSDQRRHDGWYDLGCGEIRLALRFVHNPGMLLREYLGMMGKSIKTTENFLSRSNFIVQEYRFDQLYWKMKRFLIGRLYKEAKVLKLFMENNAKKLQRAFKRRVNLSLTEDFEGREEEEEDDLDTFLKKIDSEVVKIKGSGDERGSYLSLRDCDMEIEVPPYVEAVEKVCKRRIAIKKY